MNIEPRNASRYDISGSFGFADAVEAKARVEQLIDEHSDEVVIGLGGVTDGGSVLAALMMGWLRYARRNERRIEFVDVPPKLAQLLAFTGLDEVLPMQGARADGGK